MEKKTRKRIKGVFSNWNVTLFLRNMNKICGSDFDVLILID
jgi:hypothetical protein